MARLGSQGEVCLGEAGQGRHGKAAEVWQGPARIGAARQSRCVWARIGKVGMLRRGEAGLKSQKGDKVMIYKWKIPGLIPVDAQTAGEELQRIYQEKGGLNPSDIVKESRNDSAPLHPCFEWDDEIAAEKYRQTQAQMIVQSIVTVHEMPDREPVETRAFVSVRQEYKPIEVVISSEEQMQELLKTALAELMTFRRKYSILLELAGVMCAIEEVVS